MFTKEEAVRVCSGLVATGTGTRNSVGIPTEVEPKVCVLIPFHSERVFRFVNLYKYTAKTRWLF